MRILAVDTTGEWGSLALRERGQTLAERNIHAPHGFSQTIFAELHALLKDSGWSLNDVDCFAVAHGPGSFTGVRIGLTLVKGFAEALNKPVAMVSNLRALATFGTGPRRVTLLDARRGDVFAAVYDADLALITPETVQRLQHFTIEPGTEIITLPQPPFEPVLNEFWGHSRIQAGPWLAGAIAVCAEMDGEQGKFTTALAADANYVRSADAEMQWRDR